MFSDNARVAYTVIGCILIGFLVYAARAAIDAYIPCVADSSSPERAQQIMLSLKSGLYSKLFIAACVACFITVFRSIVVLLNADSAYKKRSQNKLLGNDSKYAELLKDAERKHHEALEEMKKDQAATNAKTEQVYAELAKARRCFNAELDGFVKTKNYQEISQVIELVNRQATHLLKVMTTTERPDGRTVFNTSEKDRSRAMAHTARAWCADRHTELKAISDNSTKLSIIAKKTAV